MDFYKTLDYFRWAKKMDFISWDCYPENGQPYARTSMAHDHMRGIKGRTVFCSHGTDADGIQLASVQCPEAAGRDAAVKLIRRWRMGRTR